MSNDNSPKGKKWRQLFALVVVVLLVAIIALLVEISLTLHDRRMAAPSVVQVTVTNQIPAIAPMPLPNGAGMQPPNQAALPPAPRPPAPQTPDETHINLSQIIKLTHVQQKISEAARGIDRKLGNHHGPSRQNGRRPEDSRSGPGSQLPAGAEKNPNLPATFLPSREEWPKSPYAPATWPTNAAPKKAAGNPYSGVPAIKIAVP